MVKIQKKRKGMASLWRRTAAVCGVLTLTASLLAGCGQKENEETQRLRIRAYLRKNRRKRTRRENRPTRKMPRWWKTTESTAS